MIRLTRLLWSLHCRLVGGHEQPHVAPRPRPLVSIRETHSAFRHCHTLCIIVLLYGLVSVYEYTYSMHPSTLVSKDLKPPYMNYTGTIPREKTGLRLSP